jgi:hypothetical protein
LGFSLQAFFLNVVTSLQAFFLNVLTSLQAFFLNVLTSLQAFFLNVLPVSFDTFLLLFHCLLFQVHLYRLHYVYDAVILYPATALNKQNF